MIIYPGLDGGLERDMKGRGSDWSWKSEHIETTDPSSVTLVDMLSI